ncbi:MAG: DUF2076 domain-containing protein [Hyphomicrobiales bacterium]|jgi:uncharacterized protein
MESKSSANRGEFFNGLLSVKFALLDPKGIKNMDRNDQQAIENLFGKLAEVERQSPPRDAESEAFIRERIARQPGAPYYMAQTVVVQEQALEAAQVRIEELEAQISRAPQSSGGGLLGKLFGDTQQPSRSTGSVPRAGRPRGITPQQAQRGGGGFLAGAAQTAMGVAGGLLLGNAIAGMLGGDEAQAAGADAGTEEPQADNAGVDDGGGFDDMEF